MKIWIVLIAVGLVGCKGNQGGQIVATGSTAASTPTVSALPTPVEQAEALAEDVQTYLEQSAWPTAEAKLRELQGVGEKLASAGVVETKRSAFGNAVDSLSAAIAHRSRAGALTAGNRVSRVVTGIMADYPMKVPVDVTYMDVAGRDALYAAEQGRWSDAANAAEEIGQRYAAVQAHVRARDPVLDKRVSAEIAELYRAVESRARARADRLARALLEDVDRIELGF